MSDEKIHQPHDKLFKAGFGDPVNAAGLLQWQLPAAISEKIDWDQLRLEPGSFIDSHYRHNESDLLFSAPLAGVDCLIHVLFEHQITEDATLALRLLRYMVRIWELRLKSHPAQSHRLPVIIPVVLAQNAEVWRIRSDFASLLDVPNGMDGDLRVFIPDFTFRLIQLAALPFDAIRGTPAGIMIMRTMKAERAAKLLADPVWDESLLVRIPRETFELLIRYILNADIDMDAFDGRVKSIQQSETRFTAMTLADQLREDGLQKGLQKGRQEGRQEGQIVAQQTAVIEALEIRFGQVSQGLSEAIQTIHDESGLRLLLKAAIQSASIEDFSKAL
jgi:predicted transposase YdaD